MFVRTIWYVAGWDVDVPGDGLFSRTLCGIPVVFWLIQKEQAAEREPR